MRSSLTQTILKLAGALAIVLGSFFITLKALDYWAPTPPPSMPEPAYDAAALPQLSPGKKLDFSNGQNRGALLSGWSDAEPSGVWSDGHNAFIGFVVGNGATASEAVLHADIFLVPPTLREQTVQIWSAGSKLAEYQLDTLHSDIKIPLRGIATKTGTPVVLGFQLPNAISSHAVTGSADTRVIALSVQSLELLP